MIKIINWNISYMGDVEKKIDYLLSVIDENTCAILEEVKPASREKIVSRLNVNYNFAYSLDYRKPSKFDSEARNLGVLLIAGRNISIVKAGVAERSLFPDRTICATLGIGSQQIKILGIHSITGCGYKKAKSVQYDSLAEFVDTFNPDIICMDANEPEVDSPRIKEMVFFNNGKGAKVFFETVDAALADSFVQANGSVSKENLPISHFVKNKGFARYDFVFVNKKIEIMACNYKYEEAIVAGSDHAILITEILI